MIHLIGLAGVLAIAFAAIFFRLADVSPATATFFRTLYAVPVLFIIWRMTRRADRRPASARWLAAASGLILAADLTLWHESIRRIGVGLGTVLANIQVIFVGAAAWVLHRERPTMLAVVVIPVVLAGVVLVSGLGRADAYGSDPAGGVIFGILAAAAYAGYLLQFRAANRTLAPSAGPLLDATTGAAIGALITGLPFDRQFSFAVTWPAHGWLLALALVCQVAGWLLIGTALPRLAALEMSILLLAQPIGTLLLGLMIFGEHLSSVQWAGVALVLAGVAVLTMGRAVEPGQEKRRTKKEKRAARSGALVVLPFTFFLSSCAPVRPITGADAERARLNRIAETVTIYRDEYAVPHIYGPTDPSVVFGLMYAQAEDNFWQIEDDYIRRLGRAAEVYGEMQIGGDMLLRAFEDSTLAREEYAKSDARVRAIADAFADGLNYFRLTHPEVRPRLLQRFEPWHVFTGRVPRGARVDGVRLDAQWGSAPPPEIPAADLDEGSNTWALAPKRSASGRALLFINPHVGFFGGGQRYELHLNSGEGWHFAGFAILGYPVPRAGHNEHLGWSHTNTDTDTADVYLETFDHPTDRLSYRYGDGYRRATEWTDTVRVKRGELIEDRTVTFLKTHHGPIVGERDGRRLSVRFATTREGGGIAQWYEMGRSRTLAEFKRALARRAFYISNTMYADRDGDIFYLHGNAVPKRATHVDWTKPVDGSDPETEWRGYHEIDELPQVTNPPSGYLQNCNSTPFLTTDAGNPDKARYPQYMTRDVDSPRALASRRILAGGRTFTFDEWARAAFDTRVARADETVPRILQAWDRLSASPRSRTLLPVVDVLRTWDRVSTIESIPMTLFVLTQEGMNNGAEPMDALAQSVEALERTHGTWRVPWGDINRLQRVHTAGRETFRDDRPSVPVPGAPGWAGLVFTFVANPVAGQKRRYGVSGHTYVAVVEFARPVRARSLLVFGQSGDPSSPHYVDQAPLYSRGEFKTAWFSRAQVKSAARRTYHPGL